MTDTPARTTSTHRAERMAMAAHVLGVLVHRAMCRGAFTEAEKDLAASARRLAGSVLAHRQQAVSRAQRRRWAKKAVEAAETRRTQ